MSARQSRAARHKRANAHAARAKVEIELVRSHARTENDEEEALLAFANDGAILSMPPTIPARLQEAITDAVTARFGFPEDLDAWLHAPNIVLGGASPFERIAVGDGISALRALGIAAPTTTRLTEPCHRDATDGSSVDRGSINSQTAPARAARRR